MAEYIDREALRKILENWRDAHADVDDEQGCGLLEYVIREVDAQTAADVAPVVHGRWVDEEPNLTLGCYRHSAHYQCSVCGRRTGKAQTRSYRYCPKCGARMDGEA